MEDCEAVPDAFAASLACMMKYPARRLQPSEEKLKSMRRWTPWLLLCWALAFAGPLRAEQALLRDFGPDDGLESLAVRSVAQDVEGFLWVGTDNGLYRFDGVRFRRLGRNRGSPG
ncbi:MAG TPA: hypothetical protein VIN58_11545, partial [Roseateles sp.]